MPAVFLLVLIHGYTLCYCGQRHPGTNMVRLQHYLWNVSCNTYSICVQSCPQAVQTLAKEGAITAAGEWVVWRNLYITWELEPFQSRVLGVLWDDLWNVYHLSRNAHLFPIVLFIYCMYNYKVPWFDHLIPCAIWWWHVPQKLNILGHVLYNTLNFLA